MDEFPLVQSTSNAVLIMHLTPEDKSALIKECGDVLWYVSAFLGEIGSDLQEAMDTNVEKLTSPEIYQDQLFRLIPTKRIGEPEDVAQAAIWLASDASDYVHGITLYIDGGMTLYPGFIGGG